MNEWNKQTKTSTEQSFPSLIFFLAWKEKIFCYFLKVFLILQMILWNINLSSFPQVLAWDLNTYEQYMNENSFGSWVHSTVLELFY